MLNPINTLPIQQFIQQVKAAELGNQREIKLDIKSARALVLCLGELNAKLVQDYDRILTELQNNAGEGEVTVNMDGGNL